MNKFEWPEGTEALLDEILTDAYGDDEQLWAIRQAFEDNVKVPADLSSAAFALVAAIVADDCEVVVKNVGVNPTRTGVLEILKQIAIITGNLYNLRVGIESKTFNHFF